MSSKCSCGFQYKNGDKFCMKCGRKISAPAAARKAPQAQTVSNPFASAFNPEGLMQIAQNAEKFNEDYLAAQGIDIEKYRKRRQAEKLSPEERRGKTPWEIESLEIEKRIDLQRKDLKEMEPKLSVEFFHIVKPKYKTAEPDREKMIEKLNEYTMLRYKDNSVFFESFMAMGESMGGKDKDTAVKSAGTIEALINYKPRKNPPPIGEMAMYTYRNAYLGAVALVDEYCQCMREGREMREFSREDEIIQEGGRPMKLTTDRPTGRTRIIE